LHPGKSPYAGKPTANRNRTKTGKAMKRSLFALSLAAIAASATIASAQTEILNASYDLSREFYGEFNPAFEAYYKGKAGQEVKVKQSNGGSSKQARAVLDG